MRPGRTPPSPTCVAASRGSRSRSRRPRSPGPTTARPRATPPPDRPQEELAGVSVPSCPCSAPPAPGRPTTSRPTPTRSPPSSSPAAACLCAHPIRPDPRPVAAAEVAPTSAYYGEDTPRPRSERHAAQDRCYADFLERRLGEVRRMTLLRG